MNIRFYLELATRVQDGRLLDLLRIPVSASVEKGEWSARWWSHGKTKRMRSSDRDKILRRIAEDRLNELELKWRCESSSTNCRSLRLVDLWNSFSPEQTTSLWAPVPTEKLSSHDDERKRKNFGGGDPPMRQGYRLPRPSTLECFWEFELEEHNLPDAALQSKIIEWLRPTIQEACKSLNCFGYGCVHGSCRKMTMLSSMGGVAPWIDELGEKFENIYPILIGATASCEGLAEVLRDRGTLIRISKEAPTAIVSIPSDRVEEIRQDRAVKEWVVIRDLGKLEAPVATLDAIYDRLRALSWEAPFVKR